MSVLLLVLLVSVLLLLELLVSVLLLLELREVLVPALMVVLVGAAVVLPELLSGGSGGRGIKVSAAHITASCSGGKADWQEGSTRSRWQHSKQPRPERDTQTPYEVTRQHVVVVSDLAHLLAGR